MRRICLLVVLTMFSSLFVYAQANVSSITINASGAALLATDGLSPSTATGYARLTGDGRTPLPAGQAIFGFSKSGVPSAKLLCRAPILFRRAESMRKWSDP